jgi:hypothetical protein
MPIQFQNLNGTIAAVDTDTGDVLWIVGPAEAEEERLPPPPGPGQALAGAIRQGLQDSPLIPWLRGRLAEYADPNAPTYLPGAIYEPTIQQLAAQGQGLRGVGQALGQGMVMERPEVPAWKMLDPQAGPAIQYPFDPVPVQALQAAGPPYTPSYISPEAGDVPFGGRPSPYQPATFTGTGLEPGLGAEPIMPGEREAAAQLQQAGRAAQPQDYWGTGDFTNPPPIFRLRMGPGRELSRPQTEAWWEAFKAEHGGQDPITWYSDETKRHRRPGAMPGPQGALQSAEADAAWANDVADRNERAGRGRVGPSEGEWEDHWYQSRGMMTPREWTRRSTEPRGPSPADQLAEAQRLNAERQAAQRAALAPRTVTRWDRF